MNLLSTVIGGEFKFQVQDSDLEYFFGDLKNTSHFLKKGTFKTDLKFATYLQFTLTFSKCFR